MQALRSSFRDPAGYVVHDAGLVKRVIRDFGRADYARYMASGLHTELAGRGLVLHHYEERRTGLWPTGAVNVIVPRQLSYISYPYEWSFPQLRDAALLTLEIQERALRSGLSLKDASAYNVQFDGCRPVFIDTLSFTADSGQSWIAYEQFCRHFLGPLLLMQYGMEDAGAILATALDGFPIDWTARMLPWKSYFRPGALVHIHLHSLCQRRAGEGMTRIPGKQSLGARRGLLASLRGVVESLRGPSTASAWQDYRKTRAHYPASSQDSKSRTVQGVIARLKPSLVYDLGANDGEFSEVAARGGARCVAFDRDASCVAAIYREGRANSGSQWLLPLVMDLHNPSPSLGFGHEERMSFCERGDADLTLVLGLVHHLRLNGNIPLAALGRFLARFSKYVLIEFVPRDDPKAAAMLHGRKGFEDYSLEGLIESFERRFRLIERIPIDSSPRSLLLFGRLD